MCQNCQGRRSDNVKLLVKSLRAVRSEIAGGLEVWHSACNRGTRVRFPVGNQPFPALQVCFWENIYLVIFYVCWHWSVMFVHIYTCMFVNIHLWYTYYIFTVYLLDKLMTILSTIFVFCCFSAILFIINLLTIEMLGIYNGWSDMAWWMSFVSLW